MLLITIFVELRVVAERSRTRAGSLQAVSQRPCCAVALRRTAWSQQDMSAAWQVWIRHGRTVLNQMGKTYSKPLAAWHGRGKAWARHAMCESAFRLHVRCGIGHQVGSQQLGTQWWEQRFILTTKVTDCLLSVCAS